MKTDDEGALDTFLVSEFLPNKPKNQWAMYIYIFCQRGAN